MTRKVEPIRVIELPKNDDYFEFIYPSVNKVNTLKEVISQWQHEEYYTVTGMVNQIVVVNRKDYDYLINSFLDDQDFYSDQGGTFENESGKTIEAVTALWCHNELTFTLVNPQGYSYARYAGHIPYDDEHNRMSVLDILCDYMTAEEKAIALVNIHFDQLYGLENHKAHLVKTMIPFGTTLALDVEKILNNNDHSKYRQHMAIKQAVLNYFNPLNSNAMEPEDQIVADVAIHYDDNLERVYLDVSKNYAFYDEIISLLKDKYNGKKTDKSKALFFYSGKLKKSVCNPFHEEFKLEVFKEFLKDLESIDSDIQVFISNEAQQVLGVKVNE